MSVKDTPAVIEAIRLLKLDGAPDVHWLLGDNLCDCLFQRIGDWANPYLGRTLRVRLCCIWADIYKQYPQYVQELPYYDPNRHTYTGTPLAWDSTEMDMPLYLWHRQLAIEQGKPLEQIRAEYTGREKERPKKVAHRVVKDATKAEMRHAEEQRLKLSGWLLEDENLA